MGRLGFTIELFRLVMALDYKQLIFGKTSLDLDRLPVFCNFLSWVYIRAANAFSGLETAQPLFLQ
jgi:hypothetical protein